MVFEFRSRTGSSFAGSNTSEGVVTMNVQYDVSDQFFLYHFNMLNYSGTQSAPASQDFDFHVDVGKGSKGNLLRMLFVGNTPSDITTDRRLYDFGRFNIATSSFRDVQTVGELYVRYKCCFYKQNVRASLGYDYPYLHFRGSPDFSAALPYGTAPKRSPASTLGTAVAAGNQLILPRSTPTGNYLLTYFWQGDSTSVATPVVTFSDNMVGLYIFRNGAAYVTNPGPSTNTNFVLNVAFTLKTHL